MKKRLARILAVGLFLIVIGYGDIIDEGSTTMKSAVSTANATYSIVITETLFDYIGGKAVRGTLSIKDSQTSKPIPAEETFRTDNSDPPGGSFANNVKIYTYNVPLGKKTHIEYTQPDTPSPTAVYIKQPTVNSDQQNSRTDVSFVYNEIGNDEDIIIDITLAWWLNPPS
jgi:hypothetical protein